VSESSGAGDLVADVRTSHLDGHLAPRISQTRAVYLRHGRCRHRLAGELGEDDLERPVQLGFDGGSDGFEGKRGHPVLQRLQLVDHAARKQVTPGGHDLTDLDEGRTEPRAQCGERDSDGTGHVAVPQEAGSEDAESR